MAEYTSPEHHPAFEEYCETIFELNEDGQRVIQARIAERLEVSRPAVSEMVRRLVDDGLVTVTKNEISLTPSGRELATTMVRRHRLAERDIDLEVSDEALDRLGEVGFDPVYGARPLKRAVQQHLENALAREILSGRFSPGDCVEVTWPGDKPAFSRRSQRAA